ncbi:IGHMBP2 family helicase [Olivibacter sp. XZL3]|uniref:IGHMBP2 family helicase n=1 Tax=Olivibacter sp. XZL3 TaxID=1735116 RepID=UPI001066BF2A|nr:IGHMBP2 family helicase [Olivibacter sp. XZL3]
MNYFEKLSTLLSMEREEDKQLFYNTLATTTINQRRIDGNTWYPIIIKTVEIGMGEYLSIEIERPSHHEIIHHFRFGMQVAIFSNIDPLNHRIWGHVSSLLENTMKISLRIDELPDWTQKGKLGVDLLFDEYSYDQMQKALDNASDQRNLKPLIQVITGAKKPTFTPHAPLVYSPSLNDSQKSAIQKIVSAENIAIVHGPPGTGKTTTLIEATKALLQANARQLLIVAPSNTAVDLLTEKLMEAQVRVVRVGNPLRITPRLLYSTLDAQVAQQTQMTDAKKIRKRANQFRETAQKYKRSFGKAEREQRKALFSEAVNLMKEANRLEQAATQSVLNSARVITATLVGSNHSALDKRTFGTVIIDEAGQALEPACWIPILKGEKLILTGDHQQLPPTVKSKKAVEQGLTETLMAKCVHLYPESVITLTEQYRMHASIMHFPSLKFYNENLTAHPSVATARLFPTDKPLQFIDTAGCGFYEQHQESSISNPEEASFLFQYLATFLNDLALHYSPNDYPSIGIISPYAAQVNQLITLFETSPLFLYKEKIAINTIDGFQGQERDIVLISMTRSNPRREIGFLADIRRMNVAMTRAKKKLVIIGDSLTLSSSFFYAEFIRYTEEEQAYHSAWEYINL